jgi:hypothetical protein
MALIHKYTVSWPKRFGRDKYNVFIEEVGEAFAGLGIRLNPDPKESLNNDK